MEKKMEHLTGKLEQLTHVGFKLDGMGWLQSHVQAPDEVSRNLSLWHACDL